MVSSTSQTQVLVQLQVYPPADTVSEASLPLTFFDVAWLFTGPVERLFFYPYPHPVSDFTTRFVPAVESCLSHVLRQFYPLAGRVRPPRDLSPNARYEIQSSVGDSVSLTLAECSGDFRQIAGDGPREFSNIYSLVPQLPRYDDGTIPLMALQVTVFPGQGLAIGVAVHHVACDDASSIHFVKAWADASKAKLNGFESLDLPAPLYDRSVIADPDGLYFKIIAEMQALAAAGPPPPPVDLTPVTTGGDDALIASFSISREQIEKLKQGVAARAGGDVHLSSFVVACAFAWRCLVKAQEQHYATKKKAHLLFSVECRRRLQPLVAPEYFGNCLRPCFVEVETCELAGDDGVWAASNAIGRAIKELGKGVLRGAEGWLQKIVSLAAERPMSVAGSPKYGVYEMDFGLGKPIKVEMPSIEKTPGTISLAEGREGEGIEMGLVLPRPEMVQFTACFRDALERLR